VYNKYTTCTTNYIVIGFVFLMTLRVLHLIITCWLVTHVRLADSREKTRVCHPQSLEVPPAVKHRTSKLTIAHRGASYHLPEHTLAAYRTALSLRADFIELDIVASSDGSLWALHSVDLNKTTDLMGVFGSAKDPVFSPVENASGYWVYNFTGEELSQLRVKQRLPNGRATLYDGLWGVPRLEDVLELLIDWNQVDLPQILASGPETDGAGRLRLEQAGLYLELKEANRLKSEAGLDLVDLLFKHMDDHWDLWKHIVVQCESNVRFDEYSVPGLVIQSFDVEALIRFSETWEQRFENPFNDDSDGLHASNASKILSASPPLVALLNYHGCSGVDGDEFWLHVEKKWSTMLHGVGCDKKCLLDAPGEEFSRRAQEHGLVLHPWTERPELSFVDARFQSTVEETRYLFCKRPAVGGIFTESVSLAREAALSSCDDDASGDKTEANEVPAASSDICQHDENQNMLVILAAALCFGIALTGIVIRRVCGRSQARNCQARQSVPQAEMAVDSDDFEIS